VALAKRNQKSTHITTHFFEAMWRGVSKISRSGRVVLPSPWRASVSAPHSNCPTQASSDWKLPAQALLAKNLSDLDLVSVRKSLKSFDGTLPIEQASMPPSSWYLTEAFMRAEMSGIFSKTWQFACRSDQVKSPGQYVATYTANADPILVSRGDDGVLRAFANVCRHHAARVAEGTGYAKEFVCPYHSWTYNQEGRLTKATKLKGIQDFSASKIRLTSLRVEQWGPLVFVNQSPEPEPSLPVPLWQRPISSQLKEVVESMDAMDFTDPSGKKALTWSEGDWTNFHFLQRRVYEISCNWKVYCDNYLDGGYHIPSLHLGLNSELDMASYRTRLTDTVSIQTCQAKSSRVGRDTVYAFLFPNLALNRYGDWLDTNLVIPLSPDKCVIVFDWYHRHASVETNNSDGTSEGMNAKLIRSLEESKEIQDEDISISESVQCGIGSSTYEKGRYAPGIEIAEYHFHQLIHNALETEMRSRE
jgi:choline monooxygenase